MQPLVEYLVPQTGWHQHSLLLLWRTQMRHHHPDHNIYNWKLYLCFTILVDVYSVQVCLNDLVSCWIHSGASITLSNKLLIFYNHKSIRQFWIDEAQARKNLDFLHILMVCNIISAKQCRCTLTLKSLFFDQICNNVIK